MRDPWSVIVRPVVTEKSTRGTQSNAHTFVVMKEANKHEIRHAVEVAFGVKVEEVRTLNVKGKQKRMRNMVLKGRRSDWKKAFVTLKEGSRLDII